MTDINLRKSMMCMLLAFLMPLATGADELADMQYGVSDAQKKYDLEKARYDDATVLVNEQKQRVEADQALLNERQKQQAAAKASLAKAKARLDVESSKLQKAWDKRGH